MSAPNKGKKYPAEVLTQAEVAAILATCSTRAPTGIRNRAVITLLYRSGLRVSELTALRPADVDLRKHTLRVLHGKGDKATVRGFHPSADDALARWMDTRKGLGFRNGPLFCTLDGTPLHPQYVRNMLHQRAAKAGIEKRVHPHGLRHTFAVELEQAGTPVTVISKLLGHSSTAITAQYLDHLSNAQAVAVLEGVDLPGLESDLRRVLVLAAVLLAVRVVVGAVVLVRKPADRLAAAGADTRHQVPAVTVMAPGGVVP